MPPGLRKAALTAHVTSSVGWLGSVAAFLALAVAGVTSTQDQMVRAAYLAMDVLGRTVLVPLALASLVTGLVQSLGTSWGLFRHYWVLVKLVITVLATAVLLLYTSTLSYLADTASNPAALRQLGALPSTSPVLHSAAALLMLLLPTVLSVYKPRGVTPYGRRKQQEQRPAQPDQMRRTASAARTSWSREVAIVVLALHRFVLANRSQVWFGALVQARGGLRRGAPHA